MRPTVRMLALLPLLAAACDNIRTTGNAPVQLQQPIAFIHPDWVVRDQGNLRSGAPICTVSAGELDVTLHGTGGGVTHQVGTSNLLNPGDSFKVLVGKHVYDSSSGWFNARDSKAIAEQMMSADLVYTETRRRVIANRGSQYRNFNNKISTDGFAQAYQICERFVRKGR